MPPSAQSSMVSDVMLSPQGARPGAASHATSPLCDRPAASKQPRRPPAVCRLGWRLQRRYPRWRGGAHAGHGRGPVWPTGLNRRLCTGGDRGPIRFPIRDEDERCVASGGPGAARGPRGQRRRHFPREHSQRPRGCERHSTALPGTRRPGAGHTPRRSGSAGGTGSRRRSGWARCHRPRDRTGPDAAGQAWRGPGRAARVRG